MKKQPSLTQVRCPSLNGKSQFYLSFCEWTKWCLCQWYFQFLKMPQGDQLDGYIVFLYCYTLILYCASSTWIRALFDDKSNLHFLNICLCNALPENCLILSSLVFLEPGCYNNIHIHVIHVLVFWYKYLTFSFGLYFFEV